MFLLAWVGIYFRVCPGHEDKKMLHTDPYYKQAGKTFTALLDPNEGKNYNK